MTNCKKKKTKSEYFLKKIIEFDRKVDDAAGATAVHLVNGIWGQLSVGLFADSPTELKGIFLGGGPYQLLVQAISSVFLTVWSMVSTLLILFVINKIIKIRLDEDAERTGCDSLLHFQGENLIQNFKIGDQMHQRKLGANLDRYKPVYVNRTFQNDENLY